MKTFKVTEQHLKLLQRMYIWFNNTMYSGAPAVDIKRPYGNQSVVEDIGDIIGEEPAGGTDGDFPLYSKTQQAKLLNLHEEMGDVLQILTRNLGIKPGVYERGDYDVNWTPAKPKKKRDYVFDSKQANINYGKSQKKIFNKGS